MKTLELNKSIARKVLSIVDHPGGLTHMKSSLILTLLDAHVEREEVVRRQNERAERAAIERWKVSRNKSRKSIDSVSRLKQHNAHE